MLKKGLALLIVVTSIMLFYRLSTFRYIIYNNSGMPVQLLTLQSDVILQSFRNIQDQQIIEGSVFMPLSRTLTIQLKNRNIGRSAVLKCSHPFSGAQFNQLEIGFGAELKVGALGIQQGSDNK
jgi:hypothetical protein